MSKYTDKNWEKIEKALKKKGLGSSDSVLMKVEELAEEIKAYVLSHASKPGGGVDGTPIDTGNLLDSIGVGIYLNGTLVSFKTGDKSAIESQHFGNEEYWGRDKLNYALNRTSDLGNELTLKVFSASPISQMINEEGSSIGRGVDYFEDIKDFAIKARERIFKK